MRSDTISTHLPIAGAPWHIAGAGPAGLTAAIVLARAGRRVIVHEAQPRVGARWHGGWQIIENFIHSEDALALFRRLGIPVRFRHQVVRGLTVFDDRMRRTTLQSAEPLGYLVRRGEDVTWLDGGLLAAARETGVEVHFGSRLGLEESAAVRATGPTAADGLGCELVFPTTLRDRLQVILDPALVPGGYAYLFVHDGWATIGMALVRGFKQLEQYWTATLQRFQALEPFETGNARRSIAYVNFFLTRRRLLQGALVAGEAAGLQDNLLGFGIRSAVLSGALAAQALLGGEDYDAACRRQVEDAQTMGLWMRYLYEHGGALGARWLIRGARRHGDLREYLYRWYRPTWWKWGTLPWVRRRWRAHGACAHPPFAHWCRARP